MQTSVKGPSWAGIYYTLPFFSNSHICCDEINFCFGTKPVFRSTDLV